MARRKKRNNDSGGGSEWLNTYADMVTLLLTFFILMFSMSTMDAQKFQALANAFKSVLSGESGSTVFENTLSEGLENTSGAEAEISMEQGHNSEYEEIYNAVEELIDENNLQEVAQVKEDNRGVIIELKDKILFDSGKAEIKESSIPVLDKIYEVIEKLPNTIEIQGHTDNIPISNSSYKDNFSLSGARAYAVLDYYRNKGIPGGRLNYRGMGEFSPIAPNDTDENRSMNRRVNILIEVSGKGN